MRSSKVLIAQNNDNEIGQVKNKKLHSTNGSSFLQSIDYTYSERGWLTAGSSPWFDLKLRYNNPTKGALAQF